MNTERQQRKRLKEKPHKKHMESFSLLVAVVVVDIEVEKTRKASEMSSKVLSTFSLDRLPNDNSKGKQQ